MVVLYKLLTLVASLPLLVSSAAAVVPGTPKRGVNSGIYASYVLESFESNTTGTALERRAEINDCVKYTETFSNCFPQFTSGTMRKEIGDTIGAGIKGQSDLHSCSTQGGEVDGVQWRYVATGQSCGTSAEIKTIRGAVDAALRDVPLISGPDISPLLPQVLPHRRTAGPTAMALAAPKVVPMISADVPVKLDVQLSNDFLMLEIDAPGRLLKVDEQNKINFSRYTSVQRPRDLSSKAPTIVSPWFLRYPISATQVRLHYLQQRPPPIASPAIRHEEMKNRRRYHGKSPFTPCIESRLEADQQLELQNARLVSRLVRTCLSSGRDSNPRPGHYDENFSDTASWLFSYAVTSYSFRLDSWLINPGCPSLPEQLRRYGISCPRDGSTLSLSTRNMSDFAVIAESSIGTSSAPTGPSAPSIPTRLNLRFQLSKLIA
ncbi:hypothetical protein FB45DRAFT_871391 [Roridomyces roridus]|uniref:Secreted protein CSS2 C-terminal domain-containing protein n=1 Tax=Roridomyces roridus TaxID=1738132 RepID=A0AAD7FIC2_9AGAR|nr:hypothetical protein FB45DRAFT_871391 [Roridomyces roridus]